MELGCWESSTWGVIESGNSCLIKISGNYVAYFTPRIRPGLLWPLLSIQTAARGLALIFKIAAFVRSIMPITLGGPGLNGIRSFHGS